MKPQNEYSPQFQCISCKLTVSVTVAGELQNSNKMLFHVLACLLIWLFAAGPSLEADCIYEYQTQPIREFQCNPYLEDLQLECNVIGPRDSTYDFEIQWFHAASTDSEVVIQLSEESGYGRVNIHTNGRRSEGLRLRRSRLEISSLSEADAGIYWCQIGFTDGNRTILLLEPAQNTTLKPPEDYSGLFPCPFAYLHDATVKCALEFENDSPSITTSMPSVQPSPNLTDSSADRGKETPLIPAWGVAAIVTGGAVILALTGIVVIILGVIRSRKKSRRPKGRQRNMQTGELESTAHQSRQPRVPPKPVKPSRQHSLPNHLSVTRQASSNIEYTEVDQPLRERNRIGTQKQCKSKLTTAVRATAKGGCKTQPHSDSPRVIHDGHIYNVIDPKKRDDDHNSSVYTVPNASGTQQHPAQLPPTPSEATLVGLEQSQSSDYCTGRKYQPLSPETKEYISIYASTDNN